MSQASLFDFLRNCCGPCTLEFRKSRHLCITKPGSRATAWQRSNRPVTASRGGRWAQRIDPRSHSSVCRNFRSNKVVQRNSLRRGGKADRGRSSGSLVRIARLLLPSPPARGLTERTGRSGRTRPGTLERTFVLPPTRALGPETARPLRHFFFGHSNSAGARLRTAWGTASWNPPPRLTSRGLRYRRDRWAFRPGDPVSLLSAAARPSGAP